MRPILSTLLFIVVFSTVVGGMHYYLYARLIRGAALEPSLHRIGSTALFALAVFTPVGIVLSRVLPRELARISSGLVFGWFGLVVIAFFLLVPSEIVRLAVRAWQSLSEGGFDEERRRFLGRAIAGVVGGATLGIGGLGLASALGRVGVRRVAVELARLPDAMSGFKLVQLTDLHIGSTIGADWLERVVEQVNALEPDAVAITGDLVDGPVSRLRDQVAPLGKLKARHGVFFVTGNHEYYSGVREWLAHLPQLGISVLRNERVAIDDGEVGFDLAGVDDYSARRLAPGGARFVETATAGRDPSRELVLLAHQPKHIDEAVRAGVGLQLSGHTHGGQIFPWGLLVRLDQPFIAGLGRREDTQIYVSRGTGYWGPPMRVGAPAEITLLTLSRRA